MATDPRTHRLLPLLLAVVVVVAAPTGVLVDRDRPGPEPASGPTPVPAEASAPATGAAPSRPSRDVPTPDVTNERRGGIAARLHTDDGIPVPGHVFSLMATLGSEMTVRVYDATPFTHVAGVAADTAASNVAAAALVGELLGRPVEPREMTTPPGGGESLGLSYVLAYLNIETDGAFTGSLRVAASGTLRTQGYVGPVGAIDEKTAAARIAAVDVLFTPSNPTGVEMTGSLRRARRPEVPLGEERGWDGYREAGAGTEALAVVGVRHVGDVAAWLCGAGSDDACALLDRFEALRPIDRATAAPALTATRPARVA